MSKKKAEPQRNLTVMVWILALLTLALAFIHWLFYEETLIWGRSAVVVGCLWLAVGVLLWLTDIHWRDLVGVDVDPIVIALSGIAGLSIWVVAWWLMSWLAEDVLFEIVGGFAPPSIYQPANWEDIWTPLVITDVVLVPLGLMLLLWGGLRVHVAGLSVGQASLILGAIFGLFGIMLYGQGIVGFWGYGLCGMVAGFVSLQARSAWAGFATHAVFMYANLDLLDNLLEQMAKRTEEGRVIELEPYLGTKWLALVLIAGLTVTFLLQIIRFRTETKSGKLPPPQVQGATWLAVGLMVSIFAYLIVDEIQRRGS